MKIVAVLACIALAFGQGPHNDLDWEAYKTTYNKVYSTEDEEALRYAVFKKTQADNAAHNAKYDSTYERGVNQFSDMTDEEFKADYLSSLIIPEGLLNGTTPSGGEPWVPPPEGTVIANDMDWNQRGAVTPIKNQGQCGSCYSFSATGALEGAVFRKTGRLPSLSESQIVDCSGRYGNYGCRGGWYQSAWKYLRDCGGNQGENSYPYVARQGYCRFNRQYVVTQVRGFHDLPEGDENALTQALATVGPVSVAIDASRSGFRSYKRGVYYDPYCSSTNLDHAVLAVGYGTENGMPYYLVKNSWGTWWGANGYIKMSRNYNNQCGIASKPSYPIV